jgi:LmbE family N-acetylglucosaminyl deacetylase
MSRLVVVTALLVTLLIPAHMRAQRDLSGAARIQQSLDRLTVVGSMLMIAAHPDDENTALLAYMARGRHLRTGYLSLTRGEGGQNFIGPEQGESLGVIRTQELLAARKIDGAEQFFSRAIDFGFSKTADESLAKWGHDAILSDVVWTIRRFRPDVIVLRFSGTPRDGHGQHQASALLGKEAYEAAADPSKFPQQLRWVKPWRAKRLMWNMFGWTREMKQANEAVKDKLTIDSGEYNPVLGYSYEEIAGMSRSEHRSQAMGVPQQKGPSKDSFSPVAGDKATNDLFDGVDLTWNRIAGGKPVGDLLEQADRGFDPKHPQRTVALLLAARKAAAGLQDPYADSKRTDIDEAIALCAGLWMEASAKNYMVTPGAELSVSANVIARSSVPLRLERVELEGAGSASDNAALALASNELVERKLTVRIAADAPLTQPYWLREPRQGDRYTVTDQSMLGLAQGPAPLEAKFVIAVDGQQIEYRRPVWHRFVDTARGERTRPLEVVPPVEINMPATAMLFPTSAAKDVEVALKAPTAGYSGTAKVNVPAGWQVEPAERAFKLTAAGEQQTMSFHVTPSAAASRGEITVTVGANIHGMHVINYPHITPQTLYPIASAPVARVNAQTLARRVGYIMGPGDDMPEAIRQLGCEVTLLDAEALASGDLSHFDAIVTGVRAHSSRPDMLANKARLLEYVHNGGTLVVQYNRPEGDFTPKDTIGPYPFRIGHERVTVEEAPVEFVKPDHPLVQSPNRITASDFEGWVQERGLYFAVEWDPKYETVFSSHDPNDKPLPGGTLYAHYGRGAYVFTAYSWFRQLPAGVPGAYRIFANLLSVGKVTGNASAPTSH